MFLGGDGVLWEVPGLVLSFSVPDYVVMVLQCHMLPSSYVPSPQTQSNMNIDHGLGRICEAGSGPFPCKLIMLGRVAHTLRQINAHFPSEVKDGNGSNVL